MKLDSVLTLILTILTEGGALVPLALRAYSEIKAESGLTDEEIMAHAKAKNIENHDRLEAIIHGDA